MTRKDFVLQVTEEIQASPRAVLAGHALKAAILQGIATRPDVLAKLATVLYSMKAAKKGAKGLKKSNDFRIFGYKNFPEFNAKAREDVETFVGSLSPKDAETFQNKNNIITILMLPTTVDEEAEISEQIVSGPSTMLTFDTSVRKEYKTPGGSYVVIMWGDSAVRPPEEKLAKRKAKINKRKQAKVTPAKMKAKLKSKANKKLSMLNKQKGLLAQRQFTTKNQLQQLSALSGEFGAKDGNMRSVLGKMQANDTSVTMKTQAYNNAMAELDATGKRTVKVASDMAKRGDKVTARRMLKIIGNDAITDFVLGGGAGTTSDKIISDRKRKIRVRIKQLSAKTNELMSVIENTTDARAKASARSGMSRYTKEIKSLRAKLGTYKNLSVKAMNNKAKMLQEIHASMEELISEGAGIKEALDESLAAIDASGAQKQIIKQQVVQQVAEGTPMQYAIQQAVQENIVDDSPSLSGADTIEDLLDSVI